MIGHKKLKTNGLKNKTDKIIGNHHHHLYFHHQSSTLQSKARKKAFKKSRAIKIDRVVEKYGCQRESSQDIKKPSVFVSKKFFTGRQPREKQKKDYKCPKGIAG